MRTIAFYIDGIKIVTFLFLELGIQKGLWMRWLDNDLPLFIADSGVGLLIVLAYVSWLFIEPIITGMALIMKDRPVLLKHS